MGLCNLRNPASMLSRIRKLNKIVIELERQFQQRTKFFAFSFRKNISKYWKIIHWNVAFESSAQNSRGKAILILVVV